MCVSFSKLAHLGLVSVVSEWGNDGLLKSHFDRVVAFEIVLVLVSRLVSFSLKSQGNSNSISVFDSQEAVCGDPREIVFLVHPANAPRFGWGFLLETPQKRDLCALRGGCVISRTAPKFATQSRLFRHFSLKSRHRAHFFLSLSPNALARGALSDTTDTFKRKRKARHTKSRQVSRRGVGRGSSVSRLPEFHRQTTFVMSASL